MRLVAVVSTDGPYLLGVDRRQRRLPLQHLGVHAPARAGRPAAHVAQLICERVGCYALRAGLLHYVAVVRLLALAGGGGRNGRGRSGRGDGGGSGSGSDGIATATITIFVLIFSHTAASEDLRLPGDGRVLGPHDAPQSLTPDQLLLADGIVGTLPVLVLVGAVGAGVLQLALGQDGRRRHDAEGEGPVLEDAPPARVRVHLPGRVDHQRAEVVRRAGHEAAVLAVPVPLDRPQGRLDGEQLRQRVDRKRAVPELLWQAQQCRLPGSGIAANGGDAVGRLPFFIGLRTSPLLVVW